MAADMKGIAKRLRTEANYRRDHNGEDTVFNMSNYRLTESVPIAFGMDDMGIYADPPVYGPFDKSADPIDPQER